MILSKPVAAALLAFFPLVGGLALPFAGLAVFLLVPIATALVAHFTSVQAVPIDPFSRAATFAVLWSTVGAAALVFGSLIIVSPSADERMMVFLVLPFYCVPALFGALFGFGLRWAWFHSAT